MKFYCLCFTLMVAGVAYTQADTTAAPSFEAINKQFVDNIDIAVKKLQEITGIQTEFDKNKFEQFIKKTLSPIQEKIQELIKTLEKDSGKYGEEFKKNFESFVKQFNEAVKQINTPEVQGKVTKLHETIYASFKKVTEQLNEVAKSLGVVVPPNVQKAIYDTYDEGYKGYFKIHEKINQILKEAQAELQKKKSP